MIRLPKFAWRRYDELIELRDRCTTAAARNRQRAKKTLTDNTNPHRKKQLLVDISIISKNDARTGIQRVVRALLSQLLNPANAPEDYVVIPVAATRSSAYRTIAWPKKPTHTPTLDIEIQPGDIFLGLDLCTRIVPAQRKQLAQWQQRGAKLHFLVYDLLPVQHPDWFPRHTAKYFRHWLRTLTILADQIICISEQVSNDFNHYTQQRLGLSADRIPQRTLPMGYDIAASQPSQGLPEHFQEALAKLQATNALLMVGTLEPRKGHEQVLAALERLWETKKNYTLVIVGRPGWKTQCLQRKLRSHPEREKRLFWFDDASDEALDQLYRICHGVLIASWAEGFGLPLIEAHGYGKPILARDLAVFREQQLPKISYFEAQTAKELAEAIEIWRQNINDANQNNANMDRNAPTWDKAAKVLWQILNDHASEQRPKPWPQANTLRVVN